MEPQVHTKTKTGVELLTTSNQVEHIFGI